MISSSYLGYVLKSECFVSAIEMESVESVILQLIRCRITILLPPRDAQNAIVSYLTSVVPDRRRDRASSYGDRQAGGVSSRALLRIRSRKGNGLNPSWAGPASSSICASDSNWWNRMDIKLLHVSDAIGKGWKVFADVLSQKMVLSALNHLFHKGAILCSITGRG